MPKEPYQPVVERRSASHRIRGVDYHVSEWGRPGDPLLVMLHGWGDTGTTFQLLVDQLQRDWFVVAPDWRGFGDTRSRALSYWFPDYLADLDELLSSYSADAPANLIGHSMGANVAGLYAGIFPERVASFVNVVGFGLPSRDPGEVVAHYRRWIELGRQPAAYNSYASFSLLAQRIQKRGSHISEAVARFVARQWGHRQADGTVGIKADPAHKLPNAVLYRRAEAEACWRNVDAPVLAVLGADSEFAVNEDLESLPFANVRPVTIANAGHMIHFEQPAALAAAIEEFLSQSGS